MSTESYLSQVSLIGIEPSIATIPQVGHSWREDEIGRQHLFAIGIPAAQVGQQNFGDMAIDLIRYSSSIAIGLDVNWPKGESKPTEGMDNPLNKLQFFAVVSEARQASEVGIPRSVFKQAISQEETVKSFKHNNSPCVRIYQSLYSKTESKSSPEGQSAAKPLKAQKVWGRFND